MNSYIKLDNVSKRYLNNTSYNFTINKGDLISVSGKNGSGKTTLIKLILDFIKPDVGRITWNKKVSFSYLPERSQLPPFFSAISYLKEIYNLNKKGWDDSFLKKLDIPLKRKISKLSKGNKQKVALFRTFLGDSKIIILDEPFSGLDNVMVGIIKEKIKEEKENGRAFLISTHKPEVIDDIKTKEIIL